MAGINSTAHMVAHDAIRPIPAGGDAAASHLASSLGDQRHDTSSSPVETSGRTDPDPDKGQHFDEYA